MTRPPTKPLCACGQPVDGTTLCRRCVHTLDVALGNIPAYAADAELAEAKRKAVRYDLPRGKGGTKDPALVVDDRFLPGGTGALAIATARHTVTCWCFRILREHPGWSGPKRDTLASACAWLQGHLSVIAAATWGEECKRGLLDAERGLYRLDARGPERVYAGLCTVCLVAFDRTPLYALPDDEYVTCPADDCGMTYRVEDRRNLMRDALEYEWMTAARIADLSSYLQLIGDREWVRKKINRWHSDGALRAASVDVDGQPLFPFGEVSRLLLAADSLRAARRKQRVS